MQRTRTDGSASRLRSNSNLTSGSLLDDGEVVHPVEPRARTAMLPPVMVSSPDQPTFCPCLLTIAQAKSVDDHPLSWLGFEEDCIITSCKNGECRDFFIQSHAGNVGVAQVRGGGRGSDPTRPMHAYLVRVVSTVQEHPLLYRDPRPTLERDTTEAQMLAQKIRRPHADTMGFYRSYSNVGSPQRGCRQRRGAIDKNFERWREQRVKHGNG